MKEKLHFFTKKCTQNTIFLMLLLLLLLLLLMIPFFMQALRFYAGKIPLLADKNRRILHQFVLWSRRAHPSIWGYVLPFDSIKGCNEMQMDGSLNQPICSVHDSRHHSAYQHAVTNLQMSTTNPPPRFLSGYLSRWGISVSVLGCTDADLSLLEARREPMVISLLLPSPQPKAHDFLCGAQAPFVMPQVTPDPLALPPPGRS